MLLGTASHKDIHYVFTIPVKECLLSELLLEISVAIYIFEMVKDSFGKYQFSWDKNHGVPGRGKARGVRGNPPVPTLKKRSPLSWLLYAW